MASSSKRKLGELNNVVESDYFNENKKQRIDYPAELIALENKLVTKLSDPSMEFKADKKVAYIYNPLDYAADLHAKYVKRYCQGPKEILFLGMNPGPHGMVQTGVPFGEIPAVKDFLNITGPVKRPDIFHPSRPVQGLDCTKSEPSGKRFWGLAKELSGGDPDAFFKHAMVYNYFPLAFVGSTGKNVTPVELKKTAQQQIEKITDETLAGVIKLFNIKVVVGIGGFAKQRADVVLKTFGVPNVKVVQILHPSPRSPAANQDWNGKENKEMKMNNLDEVPSESNFNASEWMVKALELADVSLRKAEVPVGCLFIYQNEIIAQGHNTVNQTKNATRHAELNCIDQVRDKFKDRAVDVFQETYVVVTVEPCIMCTDILLRIKVSSIFFGCINDRFGGASTVYDVPRHHSNPCKIVGGIRGDEAMDKLRKFYKGVNVNSPMSSLKLKKISKSKQSFDSF